MTLWSGIASAEDPPTIELSDSQLDLNARALELIQEGKLEQATTLFQSSLALGKSNVTVLNLARTYARLGQCSTARAMYDDVETAPRVKSPTPAQIASALERYRAELETCGAVLRFKCEPETLEVRIDGAEAESCPESIRVDAGRHEVVAIRSDGEERVQIVEPGPGETVSMILVVPDPEEPVEPDPKEELEVASPEPEPAPPVEPKLPGWVQVTGWSLLGTGFTLLAVATVLDLFITTPRVNEYQADPRAGAGDRQQIRQLQRTGRILFPTGAVLLAGGGAMLAFWPREVESGPAVGLSWRFEF